MNAAEGVMWGRDLVMTSAHMMVEVDVFSCPVRFTTFASGLVTNSASACLSTIIAPDVWAFLTGGKAYKSFST